MTKRDQAGFTMIEVMVAILLTVIAVIGIMALFLSQTRASSFSRHMTEASVLAEDKLEYLRTVAPVTGSETGLDPQGQAGGAFDRAWTVTPGTDYDDIQVTVSWTEDGLLRDVIVNARRNK